jgi:hypothetical protein
MADNGCQPTALAFLRACAALGIRQAFTSYSNPQGQCRHGALLADASAMPAA